VPAVSAQVSLAPWTARRADNNADAAARLFSRQDADVVLGGGVDGLAVPIVPAAGTLFGPRGAVLCSGDGPLFVCDTGHHRLLGWHRIPEVDNAPADIVVGQKDFESEGRNGNGHVHAESLNVPTGIAFGSGMLAVADAWNHRVLLWHGLPQSSHAPADLVLGQENFAASLANRGKAAPSAASLHWPYGVAIIGERLFVADTGNRRVLVWNGMPQSHGAPADLVLGQKDFETRDDNAGHAAGASGMRWPHALALCGERLCVADAGNNRLMAWNAIPCANGAPCDFVLGQKDFAAIEHNGGGYNPDAATLNMPYGVSAMDEMLLVADTANSRLVGFDVRQLAMGAPALRLAGQDRFPDKGDNRWRIAARDSLCWPYGVAVNGGSVAVADSGNNRVLLWRNP
jgi:hypothetical protein